jgi:hypothetical protein
MSHIPFSFNCGDQDLNDFFTNDASAYQEKLLAKTYQCILNNDIIAMFSVSNDSISLSEEQKKTHPDNKQLRAYPAVKIARLGVSIKYQKQKIGTNTLNFLKIFFMVKNKTGCRYLTIDAYNKPEIISFYQKNNIQLLTESDKNKKTRTMYFDLLPYYTLIKQNPEIMKNIEKAIKDINETL